MRGAVFIILASAACVLGVSLEPVALAQVREYRPPLRGLTAGDQARGSSVINTPHNLSASGPGTVRAASEQQVCIFCHTPHHASSTQPLWNRRILPGGYTPYRSTSLDAQPGQPTGSSKLCLSCHDGTIALGDVVSRGQPIQMAGGMTTLPPGQRNLGTNLSDDHPISFKYDSTLVGKDPKLRDPATLPPEIRLDAQQELQCTSCHEPHNNSRGNFLVTDNTNSQLCNSCHQIANTTVTQHQQCADCHKQHTAPSGPFLLREAMATKTCTLCHSSNTSAPDGQTFVQGQNVAADLLKPSNHDTNPSVHVSPHAPANVNCSDCHGPHTMKAGAGGTGATAVAIPDNFGHVPGVSAQGAAVAIARHEYEVCFKCHGDASPAAPVIQRQHEQTNTRLEFANAVSMHPVTETGRNNDVPSLIAGHTTASQIRCSDCHGSDSSVRGVHGSSFDPLLTARYDMTNALPESADAYALCYRCHDRNSILSNETFAYHSLHVAGNPGSANVRYASCSACHDAHGIASGVGNATNNSNLINFDVRLVKAASNGRLEFRDSGTRSGTCNLSCHNHEHIDAAYDATTPRAPLPGLAPSGRATRSLIAPKSRTIRRGR